jgi:hypothetical protein
MQDRPTPEELLEAAITFLRDHVVPGHASSQVAFHARVAANALDIVRREMALAPAAQVLEHAALAKLLGADPGHDTARLNGMLCERIASGALDIDTPGLVACLWLLTLDKLAVDQPTYETYVRCLRDAQPDPKDH